MLHDLVWQLASWAISSAQILMLPRSMPTITPSPSVALVGGYILVVFQFWYIVVSSFVRNLSKPCFKAALSIISKYVILVRVNPRYNSLFIMPVIMLVFIGALFIKVRGAPQQFSDIKKKKKKRRRKSSPMCDQDKTIDTRGADITLLLTAALPIFILWIEADSGLVVSQFLLFLSSSMGELSMMLASLPSQVVPAFEVMHRASLVVVLLTAHTMAAEALGDEAVLVCLPVLVAALVWVTIYLGHDGSTTLRTVEAVLSKAGIPVEVICYIILAYLGQTMMAELKDEAYGATNLLSSYWYLLVVCFFSVILPCLWLFAVRQCGGKAGPSSELEAAIRLLSFCRDILFRAGVLCLVVYPLLVVQLRLQLQQLMKEKWTDLLAATMRLS